MSLLLLSSFRHPMPTLESHQANSWDSFFFADERLADGAPMLSGVSGESHAKFFLSLVEDNETPSFATFVDGVYKDFP